MPSCDCAGPSPPAQSRCPRLRSPVARHRRARLACARVVSSVSAGAVRRRLRRARFDRLRRERLVREADALGAQVRDGHDPRPEPRARDDRRRQPQRQPPDAGALSRRRPGGDDRARVGSHDGRQQPHHRRLLRRQRRPHHHHPRQRRHDLSATSSRARSARTGSAPTATTTAPTQTPTACSSYGNEFTNIRENGNHSDCLQTVWTGDGLYFLQNYLHDNRCQGFFIKDQTAGGTDGVIGPVLNVVVTNNLFLRNNAPCVPASLCAGNGGPAIVDVFGPISFFRFTNNTVWTPGVGSASVWQGRGWTGAEVIRNNVMYQVYGTPAGPERPVRPLVAVPGLGQPRLRRTASDLPAARASRTAAPPPSTSRQRATTGS